MTTDLSTSERQKIYNSWHREIYQLDLNKEEKKISQLSKIIIEQLGIGKNSKGKLLDVACGKGFFLFSLKKFNGKINLYGTDISDYAIKVAKKILNAIFSVEDGEKLLFKDNQFDYVTSLGGLEYYNSPVKGVREISRVLKKDGKAVIYVPNLMFVGYIWLAFRYGIMPSHGGSTDSGKKIYDYNFEKFYTYKGWAEIIDKGGLKIEKSLSYRFLGETMFANRFILLLYNKFLFRFVPFNLTYCFIFVCTKK